MHFYSNNTVLLAEVYAVKQSECQTEQWYEIKNLTSSSGFALNLKHATQSELKSHWGNHWMVSICSACELWIESFWSSSCFYLFFTPLWKRKVQSMSRFYYRFCKTNILIHLKQCLFFLYIPPLTIHSVYTGRRGEE